MNPCARVPLRLLAGLLAAAACLPGHALERVNLRNGFSYDCQRSETLPDGKVRLYLRSESSVAADATRSDTTPNYVDLPAERIASVDSLPDPPLLPASLPAAKEAATPLDVRALMLHAGGAHNIDVELLASVVHAESGGRPTAVSRTGARGLMQLMPGTARELRVRDVLNPEDNIDGGTAYLDLLLSRYHDNLALALAAYNAGPAAVDHFHGIPPFRETRAYVVRVMTEFKRRKAALEHTALAKF